MDRFCEGERWIEWDGCDVRAVRPCPACGGLQLDWGAGAWMLLSGEFAKREPREFMEWRCMSCNRVDVERMRSARLYFLRGA